MPRTERRALQDAQGLRLAQDLLSDRDYPPFDKSLMDGYAVRSADVAGASEQQPVELTVVGEIAAGQLPARAVGPGEAIAIMTGAPLPDGADGIIPVEQTEPIPGGVRILGADQSSRYTSKKGTDLAAGKIVLSSGTLLEAPQIAAAASVGAAEVCVYAKPRVAVLTTGDEIVPVQQMPGAAQIRNSNAPMLIAQLRRLGCDVTDLGQVPDTPAAVREALSRGLAFEALFVSGGMSMGAYDYVPSTLIELGVELKITKLRIKPGKPFVFGVRHSAEVKGSRAEKQASSFSTQPWPLGTSYVFGLPGNPVSAYVCTLRLASRLLARMGGGIVEEKWRTGRLDTGLPANGPREFYQPVLLHIQPGQRSAQNELAGIHPLAYKGSADLFTLALANAMLVRGENEPPLARGTIVRVLEM